MFLAIGGLPDRLNHHPYCRDSVDRCRRLPEFKILKIVNRPILLTYRKVSHTCVNANEKSKNGHAAKVRTI